MHFMRRLGINRLPLFFILLVTHLIVILIVITIFCFSAYYNTRESHIEKAGTSTFKLMEQLTVQLNAKVKSIIDVCFDIARNDELLRILEVYDKADMHEQVEYEGKIKDILYYYWKFPEQISNVVLFVKDKKFVSDYRNGVCPISVVEEYDWFKSLGDKSGVLIDTRKFGYIANIKDQNVTTALVKIKRKGIAGDDTRSSLGIIDIDISEDYIYKNFVQPIKFSSSTQVFLINDENIVISADDKKLIGKPLENDISGIDSKNGGYEKVKDGGSILIYTGVSDIGWRIIQYVPVSAIYEQKNLGIGTASTTIFISIIVILPLVIIISRMLSSPIKKLADSMVTVKAGDFSKIQYSTYSKEITDLYDSYNFMVEEINKLIADVQQAGEIQRQTEIKALQAQINPHFLYNTLDSINWMALDSNAPDISKMVTMLSRLFRLSLSKGHSVYRVKDELEQVTYYLEIQKVRFKNRFTYSVEANESIKDYYIPKLILQPLAENAIVHGFQHMQNGGNIQIIADIINEVIVIDIIDNGAGIPQEKASDILKKDSPEGGYGVKNVNERIQYICGAGYGLAYIFDMQTGTHARITLPVISDPECLARS